jgi:cell wall-associated NlpC family hydrolase
MYSAPSRDAEVVSQAIYGTAVGVLEQKSGWVKVRTPDQYAGWTPLDGLRLLQAGETLYATGSRVAQVESLFANIYREPDTTRHEPLVTVPFEARLAMGPANPHGSRWIEVVLADGRRGWIQAGDVTLQPKPLSIEDVIALAKRFLGVPYLWGGASTFGFDCSGFTAMLCRERGVIVPRDASQQAAWEGFAPVAKDQIRPGDFLYFGSSTRKITHTGMYIGGGEFIQATTHERPVVQIGRLDDPHWADLLVAARRLK